VIAYDNSGSKVGQASFNSDETNNKNKLTSSDTSVKPDWQRKGVATVMYQYVKEGEDYHHLTKHQSGIF
jgi:hypothetical protein